MQIVTSSFFTTLPDDITVISIARWQPKGMNHPELRALAPGPWFREVSDEEYVRRYRAQLSALDPQRIVDMIMDISGGERAALACWERPRETAWCHRSLVAVWLFERLSLPVTEYGREHEGHALLHPKLPPHLRIDRQATFSF